MRHELLTGAQASLSAWSGSSGWAGWRDAAGLALVWMRAFLRLGGVLTFTAGVLALLLVKSLVRTFGRAN